MAKLGPRERAALKQARSYEYGRRLKADMAERQDPQTVFVPIKTVNTLRDFPKHGGAGLSWHYRGHTAKRIAQG